MDYQIELTVDRPAHQVFNCINRVTEWWTYDLKGKSEKMDDVFTVEFGDIHISTQKVIEHVQNKRIVWLVTDSKLNFVQDKNEWTNTKIIFELLNRNNQTHISFKHEGLVPSFQCYEGCTKGWDYYIKESLYLFLTEGKGTPGF